MSILTFTAVVVLLTGLPDYGLPAGATIIERQALSSAAHPNRELILWMLAPQQVALEPGEPYTCPDETRGSHYTGPTRVSLLDTASRSLINTVEVRSPILNQEDTFDLPYRIEKGLFYEVEGGAPGKEGKPRIMRLKDYNGDGKALEFALFDRVNCLTLLTTLIGYSERQDRVIQYPIDLEIEGDPGRSHKTTCWEDHLFVEAPVSPGRWKYEIDYRGRGGALVHYAIRYDRKEERFRGRMRLKR